MRELRSALALVVALVVLQFAATFPIPWSTDRVLTEASGLSADLLLLLAAVVCGAAAGWPRITAAVATGVLLLLIVFRGAVIVMPLVRELEFEFGNLVELPGLWHFMTHDLSPAMLAWKITLSAAEFAAATAVLFWAWLRVARTASTARCAFVMAGCLQGIVVLGLACASVESGSLWNPVMSSRFLTKAWTALRIAIDPEIVHAPIRRRLAEAADTMERVPRDLARLGGADVHFLIVESYGRVAHRHPDLAPRLRELWAELSPRLQAAGFRVATSACHPSIRGGASWLAHAQLFSGARIDSQAAWQLMLGSTCRALPRCFAEAGYRTVEVSPAMDRHWPEGKAFYGFTDEVTQLELGYTGTVYHWGLMPDQFALHHLLENYVRPATKPLFTSFVSVTSHVPFRSVPPYVEDWQVDGKTFVAPPHAEHDVPWSGIAPPEVVLPAYRDTIVYSLRAAVGFVCRLERPSLVVVLGDHQPPFCSSLTPPETSFDVPIHVFSNRPELLLPVTAVGGFVEGFEVPVDKVAFDTTLFAPAFLQAYAK